MYSVDVKPDGVCSTIYETSLVKIMDGQLYLDDNIIPITPKMEFEISDERYCEYCDLCANCEMCNECEQKCLSIKCKERK